MGIEKKRKIYVFYAWGFLAFNIYTILGGAFVRATGSGAGCGDHWPLCGGSWIPNLAFFHTIIEFTHRISSALVTIGVLLLLLGAYLYTPKGSVVRKSAWFACLFVVFEALLGAVLVIFKLVEQNSSPMRAGIMALHLVSTFLLLAALSLCAAWSSNFPVFKLNFKNKKTYLVAFSLIGLCLVGASGALTALGDTLFKPHYLGENIVSDVLNGDHFLKSLRLYHPIIAVLIGLYTISLLLNMTRATSTFLQKILCYLVSSFIVIQFVFGFLNIYFGAPTWSQIIHLFLADIIWIGSILFFNCVVLI